MKVATLLQGALQRFRHVVGLYSCRVAVKTISGSWADGFVHAGNLAYLSLLTLFPFFIVTATLAGAVGRTDAGISAIHTFLHTVPPAVATLVQKPIADVIAARSSSGLLTIGLLLTLWTVSGFIETIREIIRRAYGTEASASIWRYRIASIVLIFGAVALMLVTFVVQIALTAIEQFIFRLVPGTADLLHLLGIGRLAPAALLFAALYGVFYALTPYRYRTGKCPIWPGAALTAAVWIGTTMLLPLIIGRFANYSVTYGSLAGVIVALLFFYIIGLGLVVGAHLNAALALTPRQVLAIGSKTAQERSHR